MAITRLKYITTNLIDDNSIISVTGSWAEVSGFPVENIYNYRVTNRALFDTAKAGEIVIDFGSAQEIDSIFIFNHNLTSSVTASIQANSADSWGAPPVDETITYNQYDMFIEITSATYRYWRIVIDDSSRSANDIALGEIVLGLQTELSKNFNWDLQERIEYNNISQRTNGGNLWTYQLFKNKSWLLNFSELTLSQKNEVLSLFDDSYGGYYPFSIILEDSAYFVRCGNVFETNRPIAVDNIESGFEISHPVEYSSTLELMEESRGI